MAKRTFEVKLEKFITLELDDAVIDVTKTEEFKKQAYNFQTVEEVAKHIGYNMVINGSSLSNLDGWADQPDSNAKIIDESPWEAEATEE